MSKDAITSAETERHKLFLECQRLLLQISRKPSSIKLLGLAKQHLIVLSNYKLGRSRDRPTNKID